jgi:nucleoside-diphosphate-sugar epimerase
MDGGVLVSLFLITAVAAIDNPKACNRKFNLGGGETLTYREMVRRVFLALGKEPVFILVPVKLAMAGYKLLGRQRKSTYDPEIFRRMNLDLIFDSAAAHEAQGYSPRPFRPTFS